MEGTKVVIYPGLQIHRWTILELGKPKERGRKTWLCRCVCGVVREVRAAHLKRGGSKSCGCLKVDTATTHKMSYHPLYKVFMTMQTRCYNTAHESYANYGERGVRICYEWLHDTTSFLNWSLSNGYETGFQIDRIDNGGDYSPNNCRWVSSRDNQLNKRLINSNNTTGFRGVCYKKRRNTYEASVCCRGTVTYIGSFSTAYSAAFARDSYIKDNGLDLPLNTNVLMNNEERYPVGYYVTSADCSLHGGK